MPYGTSTRTPSGKYVYNGLSAVPLVVTFSSLVFDFTTRSLTVEGDLVIQPTNLTTVRRGLVYVVSALPMLNELPGDVRVYLPWNMVNNGSSVRSPDLEFTYGP